MTEKNKFPKNYSPDMQISERQYVMLRARFGGMGLDIDEAYNNIPEKLLKETGATREMVLWSYVSFRRNVISPGRCFLSEQEEVIPLDPQFETLKQFKKVLRGNEVPDEEIRQLESVVVGYGFTSDECDDVINREIDRIINPNKERKYYTVSADSKEGLGIRRERNR